MNTVNQTRLNRLSRIMYVLAVIFIGVTTIIAMNGCVSRMSGHDPAAVAMDGMSNATTDKPISTAVQDWWYFLNDLSHD